MNRILTINPDGEVVSIENVNPWMIDAFYRSLKDVYSQELIAAVETDTLNELQFYLKLTSIQAKNAFIYSNWGKLECIQKLLRQRKGFTTGKYFLDEEEVLHKMDKDNMEHEMENVL